MRKVKNECQRHADELHFIAESLKEMKSLLIPTVKTVERHSAFWLLFAILGSLVTIAGTVLAFFK